MWAACNGVQKITAGGIQSYTSQNGLGSNLVMKIFKDAEHITWLATDEGLSKLNEEYYEFYEVTRGDPNIISIGADSCGHIWMGSYSGLARFQDKEIIEMDKKGAGNTGFVGALIKAPGQQLWACTDAGILRLGCAGFVPAFHTMATAAAAGRDRQTWFGCKDGSIILYDSKKFYSIDYPSHPNDPVKALFCRPEWNDMDWIWKLRHSKTEIRRNTDRVCKGIFSRKRFSQPEGTFDMPG